MSAGRPGRWPPGVGELAWPLMILFIGAVLGAVSVTVVISTITADNDIARLVARQERILTRSVAISAGAAYNPRNWASGLGPALDLASGEGGAAQVRDAAGRVIATDPSFTRRTGRPPMSAPILAHGRRVGTALVRFDNRGLGAITSEFEARRWRARLAAAAIGVLLALAAALFATRRITSPLKQVLQAMRAREAGDHEARVSEDMGAIGVLREIAEGFNTMSDALDDRDRVQRNVLAAMAHEVRTPVAVLQAGVEAMLDGVTEISAQNVAGLRDEVLRLGRMIDDLQALAAAEVAALQLTTVPQDLAVIAAQAAARLEDFFDSAGVGLTRRLIAVRARCDRERMLELITNLLTNALKFTPRGGQVVIETWPQHVGEAKLQVRDTGIGISPEDLPLVTERFFRGHGAADVAAGTGIGLAIVDELVRAHRGSLEIASEPGKGTKVTITFQRV